MTLTKIKLLILILFGTFLIGISNIQGCFAIESPTFEIIDEITPTEKIKEINLSDVFEKAKEHSYDLQISELSRLIAGQDIRIARSDYYPKLNFNAGTEYTHNFRDVRNSIVTTVGDSFVNPYTRYQAIMGITLSYNVFDFGVRRGHLDIAKEDEKLKLLEEEEKLQDLYLNVLDTYTKVMLFKRQIDINKRICELETKNYEIKKRLYNAKEISQIELNDSNVRIETAKRKINELRSMLNESLLMLSFYTGEEYDAENLKIKDFKTSDELRLQNIDYTKTVIWRIYDIQIKKKELELHVVKRTNYPKITAYGRYYLYGSDHSSYNDSWNDFRPSNYTVGGSLNMPLFDGLRNYSEIKKAELELRSAQIERDKAVGEYMTRMGTLRSNLLFAEEATKNNEKILKELEDKKQQQKRLLAKRLITPKEINDVDIEIEEQRIEFAKNSVTTNAILKSIELLTPKK